MLQRWRRTRRRWGTRHLSSCWPWHRRLRRCCWRFWARWWWVAEMRCLCKSLYHDIGNLLTLSFHWSCFPVQTMRTTRRSMVSGNFVVCLSPLFTLTSHVWPNAFCFTTAMLLQTKMRKTETSPMQRSRRLLLEKFEVWWAVQEFVLHVYLPCNLFAWLRLDHVSSWDSSIYIVVIKDS